MTSLGLDFGLKDVHVLVTGASGGIGQAIVACFRQLGARVTAQYHSDPRGLPEEDDCYVIQADVTNEQDVARLFAQATERYNTVQVLVVNHGIFPMENVPLQDMRLSQWTNTINVNLTGAFLVSREYLRHLGKLDRESPLLRAASITLVGSTSGRFGEADHADYSCSKTAMMHGLLPTLKNEIVRVAKRGRVNAVNPGWTATPLAQAVMADTRLLERVLATTPLQKVAEPIDVARQVAVMSSPVLSGHVSGLNLMVDGGMEGRLLFPPRH